MKTNKGPDNYVFHHIFSDFEEFTESTRSWDLDFIQLDRGTFKAELNQIGLDGVQILHARFNRQLLQRGSSPKGMQTFAFTEIGSSPPVWRKKQIHQDSIMFFTDKSLDVLSKAGFGVFSISIDDGILNNKMQSFGLIEPIRVYNGSDALIISQPEINRLRRQLHRIIATLNHSPDKIGNQSFSKKLKNDLSFNLFSTLASAREESSKPKSRLKIIKFRKIDNFINENSTMQILTSDLCQIAGASERTLRRAFLERYETSPMRYVKYIKLNTIRKELKQADPLKAKIVDIANNWGFWHMGQFANDYKQLFGELPKETIAGLS